MPLTVGSRVGSYEVVGLLGAGGMGEVYRARDSKLNREVALKVLPASFGQDPERLARFRREAQVLAALNHPNIAHVHGFEDGAGQDADLHALVMELVEGPTLAERISHGPIPLAEALPIAKQIAGAMEAAHEQGIIHRDLKPANIKVKEDGTVKVLDFGLAKAMANDSSAGGSAEVMNSPTLTARATELGVILGTAAYMAPEQAKGRPVDRRADIWAFGVVLFEMITGRRGYDAEDVSETLAAVLTREVDWTAMPSSTPARLKALVKDCLVRDPKERLRDIGDARRELQRMIDGAPDHAAPAAVAVAAPIAPAWQRMLPWAIAGIAVIAAMAATFMRQGAPSTSAPQVVRSQTSVPDFSLFMTITNDGTKIAYGVAGGPNTVNIAVRRVDEFEGKIIAGTGNGAFPMFSHDGQWIAFSDLTGTKIRKVPVGGGTSTTLGDGTFARGSSWAADDTIAFGGGKGLMKIPGAGGTATPLTTIDTAKGEMLHMRPQYLPDGKHLLFTIQMKDQSSPQQFAVLDLAAGTYKLIGRGGFNGRYLTSGHLAYVRGGTLFATPFDLKTLSMTGSEVPVIENVSQTGPDGTADYAVSDHGLLAYFASASGAQGTTLAWADRAGRPTILPGQAQKLWGTGRLSFDGRFVANGITDAAGNRDLWIYDTTRGAPTRVTFGGMNDYPIWSRNSKRIFFGSTKDGKSGIYVTPADGSGKPTLVANTPFPVTMESMSPDERTLLFTMAQVDGPQRLFTIEIDATGHAGEPKPLHETQSVEGFGQISPDGKWVAYMSMESGGTEIYLHGFPAAGARVRISADGGARPRWSQDGKELFFWAGTPGTRLMSVAIPNGDARAATEPKLVFQRVVGTTFDVSPDRDKFLIELTANTDGSRISLVTNWFEELNARAKPKK